jgi:hypothetical protein
MPTGKQTLLKHLSDEELRAELERREQEAQKAPTPLANPDWEKLKQWVVENVEEAAKPDGYVKDFSEYAFEQVMKTVYGPNFFDWWNEGPGNRG